MQHLEHGLLDLGPGFKSKCEKEFKKLADKTIGQMPHQSLNLTLKKRLQRLKEPFKGVLKLLREIKVIATKPYDKTPTGATQGRRAREWGNNYDLQQQRYAGYWWKTAGRKGQADQMFGALRTACGKHQTNVEYYQEALRVIWDTQQTLLNEDKYTYRIGFHGAFGFDITTTLNTKGYSRL
jgi:hypothetical protein